MTITAQELLDGFNNAGVDTVAKLAEFLTVGRAVHNAFLAAGYTTEAEATQGLTVTKLQQDVIEAQQAKSKIISDWDTELAALDAAVEAADVALQTAKADLQAYAMTGPDLSVEANQTAFLDYQAAIGSAEGDVAQAFADRDAGYATYNADINAADAALAAAEAALAAFLAGA